LLIDQEGEALHVRQGKGKKDRIVPIRRETAKAIRIYLAGTGRRLNDSGPLFRAHDRAARKLAHHRLTPDAIADVVSRCAGAAGVLDKQISPHALRHTFAIRALWGGANLVAVSKLLGHASVATTQRYLDHLELGELRAAVPPLPIEFSG
jgi:site-specific recombinase XerD